VTTLRKIWLSAPVVLFVLGLFFLVPITPAHAQVRAPQDPVCDVDVVDSAGIFTDVNQLTQRVEVIQQATGAIIKIRSFQSYGFENATDITSYKDNMVRRCSSWQGISGGLQSNYILLVISVQDRKSDYWVGDHWLSQLSQSTMDNIEISDMDPDFHTGFTTGDNSQFQAGMLAGLDQIQQEIDSAYGGQQDWGWLVIVFFIIILVVIIFLVRRFNNGGTGSYGRNEGYSSSSFIFINSSDSGSSGGDFGGGFGGGSGGAGGSTGF